MEKIPWFKFYTSFFKRQSIVLISSLRNSETIILILIRLICMATEINDRGYVYITPERPYKISELASYMQRTTKVMENVLKVLADYGEIEIEKNGMIFVTSWSEEQNVDRLEVMKADHRARQKRYREKFKLNKKQALRHSDTTGDVTVTKSDAGEEYEEEYENEYEYEYEEYKKNVDDIVFYLNSKLNSAYNPKDKFINELIVNKLKLGYCEKDFYKVIDNKLKSWENTEFAKFLRPETLFGEKFDLYLNEKQQESFDYSKSSFNISEIKNTGLFDK